MKKRTDLAKSALVWVCGLACLFVAGCVDQKSEKADQKSEITIQLPNETVSAQGISLACQTEYDFMAPCTATIQIGKKYETRHGAYIEIKGEGKTMAEAWQNALMKMNCIQPNCIKKAGKRK